jgi:hypothetical protein
MAWGVTPRVAARSWAIAHWKGPNRSNFIRIARRHQEAIGPIADQFRQSHGVGGDDRQSGGDCLQGGQALYLGGRGNGKQVHDPV